MIEVPSEKESVRFFIKNHQEKYSKHLKYQNNLHIFKAIYDIGINIEDDLAKLKAANNNSNSGWKGKKNDNPSSSKTAHSNNVSAFNLNEVLAMNNQGQKKPFRRNFTPIGMSYDTAFDRLHAKGLITPIGPFGDPPVKRRTASWNPNAHCKYHQGRGHLTENCWKLKEAIQDLIDSNKLPLPPASKKPSIDNAPLAHALAIYY